MPGSLERTQQSSKVDQNNQQNILRNNVNVKPNLLKNGLHNSDVDEWGNLNQTIGQRRKRGQVNPSLENNKRRNKDNLVDDSAIED